MNLVLKIKIFTVVFILFTCSILVGQSIRIEEQNCTSSQFNLNATMRNKILTKALVIAATKILPYELDQQKIDILKQLFENSSMKYILSYKEHEEKNQNSTSLILNVNVDIISLKNKLKNLGLYFNPKKVLVHLETEDLQQPDLEFLDSLLQLSGVSVHNNSSEIKLYIKKIKDTLYTGTLSYKDHYWAATKNSLGDLLEALWSNYFNLPEIKNKFFSKIVLSAGPWVTLTGFKIFKKRLKAKKELLERVQLISITFLPQGIFGKWEIVTIKPKLVTTFLNNYLGERGMEFNMQVLPPQ
ncbi:hypothetical protein JCM12298_19850 [Desulfothermus naphthae]